MITFPSLCTEGNFSYLNEIRLAATTRIPPVSTHASFQHTHAIAQQEQCSGINKSRIDRFTILSVPVSSVIYFRM